MSIPEHCNKVFQGVLQKNLTVLHSVTRKLLSITLTIDRLIYNMVI